MCWFNSFGFNFLEAVYGRKMGVPERLIVLLKTLYTDLEVMNGNTDWFKFGKGNTLITLIQPVC